MKQTREMEIPSMSSPSRRKTRRQPKSERPALPRSRPTLRPKAPRWATIGTDGVRAVVR